MQPRQMKHLDEVDSALKAARFLLIKHSRICPVSHRAFEEYRAFMAAHPESPSAWIDVIEQRPLSLHVASTTGIQHESPQAILMVDGVSVWSASHGEVTCAAMEQAMGFAAQADDER